MSEDKIKCVECGSEYVVNKKFMLCEEDNYKRLHKGKSKQQVYAERSLLRVSQRQISPNKKEGTRNKFNKPKNRINPISSKNKYHLYSGEILSRAELNIRLIQVYQLIDQEREPVCEGCGRNLPLSHSHIISRANRRDLICEKDNIQLHCFGSYNNCHEKWERCNLNEIVVMKDFERNMLYIRQVDTYLYNKILAKFLPSI